MTVAIALVVLIVDLADAVAVADEQLALPPREHRLAAVALDAEVGRRSCPGVDLNQTSWPLSLMIIGPSWPRPAFGREEDEAGRAARPWPWSTVTDGGVRSLRVAYACDRAAADVRQLDRARLARGLVADAEREVAVGRADDGRGRC